MSEPRKCTKEDIKGLIKQRPGLVKILRFLIDKTEPRSSSEIAEGSGLPVDEVREIMTFVEQTCESEGFENPIFRRK